MMIGYELGILKAQLFTSRDRARFTTLHKGYYYKSLERLVRKLILIANDYVLFTQQPNFLGIRVVVSQKSSVGAENSTRTTVNQDSTHPAG